MSLTRGCHIQALRSVGSGCATQADVDWVWQEVQSQVIRDMAFKDNLRTDGRGFIDIRSASFQVQAVCCCVCCAGLNPCLSGVLCLLCPELHYCVSLPYSSILLQSFCSA